MNMKPQLYIPSPVLLPVNIANKPKVQKLLLGYTDCFVWHNWAATSPPISKNQLQQKKINLLQYPIPLYHDAFFVNNKILLTGSFFPRLFSTIGEPKFFLRERGTTTTSKCNFFYDKYEKNTTHPFSPSNFVIYDLPQGVLINPAEWQLICQFDDFEQSINLQPNPFANAECKTTLNTLQQDNPAEWVSEWCNYYYLQHKIERIIVYNNGSINERSLPNLEVNQNIEVWYVKWDHLYEQYFARCQIGALTHSYNWVGKSADYFLNFDIDEYLVNDSGMPLVKYMKKSKQHGTSLGGYRMPERETPPSPDKEVTNLKDMGKKQDGAYKYIYKSGYWSILNVHAAYRRKFIPRTLSAVLLNSSTFKVGFFLYKFMYLAFKNMPFLSRYEHISHTKNLYFLHYRETRNTNWKNDANWVVL